MTWSRKGLAFSCGDESVERRSIDATQRLVVVRACGGLLRCGNAGPATKLLVDQIGAVTLAGLLYLGAAIAVAPFTVREQRSRATAGQRSRLLLAVVVGGGLAPVLLVLARDRTPAGTVSLLLNLELVATALIARVFLREHVGRRAGVGISVVVAGGVLLAGTSGAGLAAGALLVVGVCLCWGVDNAVTGSLDSYSPVRITLTKGVVAGSVNVALGIALAGAPPAQLVLPALLIGAVGYGLSITLWITGACLVGAARGQVIFALAPFVGALLAWPINGEGLTTTLAMAFAMSLAGVLIVGSARHGHRHTHEVFVHSHPIDVSETHHSIEAIEMVSDREHRHLALAHEHEHLPDIHHRHAH